MCRKLVGTLLVSLLAVGVGGCQTEVEQVVAERIENPQLGIAIAALPAPFQVAVNEGTTLELVAGEGRLSIVASPAQVAGVNLVQAVWDHKASILERPEGEYKGQQELGTYLGTAFYSRGHYQGDAGRIEETVILVVHPWSDRRLDLVYRYPATDDSKERIEKQLFAVLGQVEALPQPALPVDEPAPAVDEPAPPA
ncbi:MAG: hypothetical protein GY856_15970 [bacterium]|nr:hypothetical protein [bacterium]